MPSYRYQAFDASGAAKVGVLAADSLDNAALALRQQGLRITSIAPSNTGGSGNASLAEKWAELNHGQPKPKHVLEFTTQLAVMIRAGINLRSALEGISDQTEHPVF